MAEWLKKRAKEPSTWKGVGYVLVALGLLPMASVEVVVSVGVGLVGLVDMARKEKP